MADWQATACIPCATAAVPGTRHRWDAPGREKTGEFRVARRMPGHRAQGDFEYAEVEAV